MHLELWECQIGVERRLALRPEPRAKQSKNVPIPTGLSCGRAEVVVYPSARLGEKRHHPILGREYIYQAAYGVTDAPDITCQALED